LASLGLGLSDAHTARLTFAGWGLRPWPVSLACPMAYGVSLEAPRGALRPHL